MKHRKIISLLLAIVVAIPLLLISMHVVLANGASGGSESGTNPNPGCNSTDWHSSHCVGIGWKYYLVTDPVSGKPGYEGNNSDPNNIVVPGDNFTTGGTISGCAEVGGYYRLGFVYYRDDGNGNILEVSPIQRGLQNVDARVHFEGHGFENWNTVHDKFLQAQDAGVTSTTWGGTSYFCYSDDIVSKKGKGDFYSTSTVTVNDPDITGGKTVTSGRDGTASIEFSTDKATVTVDFSHTIGYDHGSFTMNSNDTTSGDTVTSNWSVTDAYPVGSTSWGALRPDSDHTTTPDSAKKSVPITLEPGETKTKCSKIKYDHKNVKLKGTWVCDARNAYGNCISSHYDYSASYSGNGSSKVCVTVTRPDSPGGEPKNPGGDANSKIMFAGEDTRLWWDGIHAKSQETRRLSGWKSIKFQVNQAAEYNENNFKIDSNSKSDPCSMYRARFGGTLAECKDHESGNWNTSSSSTHDHTYSKDASVKVPDYVGHKYCNSFGYSFEYWYNIEGSSDSSLNGWHHDTPKDYWYNFGAACRTIAKKPTTAAWNGSIMTMGNIVTSLASRHNSITFGENANNDRTLYGSWSEYLAIANVNLNSSRTMASGSALSQGSASLKLCDGQPWASSSSLTISNFSSGDTNVCSLTASGITGNTTFMTRLYAYLRDVQDNPNITQAHNINELYGGVNGNVVLNVNGNLRIDNNITINDSVRYSIHDVPQAVIFVNNGNVEIAENVDRVDAWLIVTGNKGANTGTINTCSGFTPGADSNKDVSSDGFGFNGNRCTKQLVFNGPVVARTINLQRSYGSDPLISRTGTFGTSSSKQAPAEVFNLRADSYLWAYAQAARYSSNYSEAYSRELAPRY